MRFLSRRPLRLFLTLIAFFVLAGSWSCTARWARNRLFSAAVSGDLATVKKEVNRRGFVAANYQKKSGRTPLMLSAFHGRTAIVRYLLSVQATATQADRRGRTALHYAATGSKLAKLAPKTTPRRTQEWLQVAQLLVAAGANVNGVDWRGAAPLSKAAHAGHLPLVRFLIKRGADVNRVTRQGTSPLEAAASGGHHAVFEYLLLRGARIAKAGCVTLLSAARGGSAKTIRLVAASGCSPNLAGPRGQAGLHLGAARGHVRAVQALLELGARVNQVDDKGLTALHWSAWRGHLKVVKALLAAGANPNARDRRGRRPLWAAHGQEVADLLRSVSR